jgi:hypothetical protein
MPSGKADATPRYERLSRGWWGLNGLGALWLGPGCLLHSTSFCGAERYRRWYFHDMQALVARRTSLRLVLNLIFGGLALLLGFGSAGAALGASAQSQAGDRGALFILAGLLGAVALVFLGLTLWNTLLGPTCSVRIQTPRGLEKLPGIARQPVFAKLTARLLPLAAAEQNEPDRAGLRATGATLEAPPA